MKTNFFPFLPLTLFFLLFFISPVKAADPGCSAQTPQCLGTSVVDTFVCDQPISPSHVCPGGYHNDYQVTVRCSMSTCTYNRCSSNDLPLVCQYFAGVGCLATNCYSSGNCCGGSGATPTPPPPQPSSPTCVIAGPSDVKTTDSSTYTVTSSANANRTGIYKYPPSSWPTICESSGNCSGATQFASPGTYWVVCNAYNDSNGLKCSGNPFTPLPSGWTDCGSSSRMQVTVVTQPTCSGVTFPSCITPGTSFTVTANGVSNATQVKFPTWSSANGQDDLFWYIDNNGSPWTVSIPQSSHTGGDINVHVYMDNSSYTNVWCGGTSIPPCCTPVNGGWSAWSAKNTACGYSGTQTRTCTNPSPNSCGAGCSGPSTQSYTNAQCLPTASCTVGPVACGGSPVITLHSTYGYYCYIYNDWANCNTGYFGSGTTCSPGAQTPGAHQGQVYCYNSDWVGSGWNTCNYTVPPPTCANLYGCGCSSTSCTGGVSIPKTCTNNLGCGCHDASCSGGTAYPAPVNGGWSGWSTKNTACGYSGTQTRTCTNPSPYSCGAGCSGPSTQSYTNPQCPPTARCTVPNQPYGGNPGITLYSTYGYYCVVWNDWVWFAQGYFGSGTYYPGPQTTPGAHQGEVYCYNSDWVISSWGTCDYNVSAIPPPTNPSASCLGSGTSATISWSLPSGYSLSYFRITDTTTGTNFSWIPENVSDTGPPKSVTTTSGHNYTWWVHTRVPSGAYSSSVGGSFTCAIPGGWTLFGPCSKTCGTGTQTRSCTNPSPQYGGTDCSGLDGGNSSRACNTQACTPAWWQVKDGDVTTNGNLQSKVPTTAIPPYFELPGGGGFPGIPSYNTTGTATFTPGGVSANGWLAASSYTSTKIYNSSYFLNEVPSDASVTTISSPSAPATTFTSGGTLKYGYYWYEYDGTNEFNINSDITAANLGTRKVILIIKNANFRITNKINLDDGSGFFMAVVGGNIIVGSGVGGGGSANLEGIYIADRQFQTGTTGSETDSQLWVRGTVVAYEGITLQRRLGDILNKTIPAELFEYAPDQDILFPSVLGRTVSNWQEVAP